jgi:hypothetical protein
MNTISECDESKRDVKKEKRRVRFRPVSCLSHKTFEHILTSFLGLWIELVGNDVLEFGVDCFTKFGRAHMRIFTSGNQTLCGLVNNTGLHIIDICECVCVLQGITVSPDEQAFNRMVDMLLQGHYGIPVSISYWVECRSTVMKSGLSDTIKCYPTRHSAELNARMRSMLVALG